MAGLRAIETVYLGHRFRSRLEARWAVFFTHLRVPFEYEPEGFELGEAGRYLPDFWLPKQECWIEIKGSSMTDREHDKVSAFADLRPARIYVFTGAIPLVVPGVWPDGGAEVFMSNGWDCNHWWCQCWNCGQVGIEFEARADRLSCKRCRECDYSLASRTAPRPACTTHGHDIGPGCPRDLSGNCDRDHSYASERLVAAYQAARQARFEFGENGNR